MTMRTVARARRIEEISTFRDQVRIRPVILKDGVTPGDGASYHDARQTLNLLPRKISGAGLPRWIRERLLDLAGEVRVAV